MSIMLSPERLRRRANARQRQQLAWARRNGPAIRIPTPTANATSPPTEQRAINGSHAIEGVAAQSRRQCATQPRS